MLSPLIQNGDFSLNNGDLVIDNTLLTQCNTTVAGYACPYSNTFQSTLIDYLANPTSINNQNNKQTLTNIVKSAYQVLIQNGYMTNLSIYVANVGNTVSIKTISTDEKQNSVTNTWNNLK